MTVALIEETRTRKVVAAGAAARKFQRVGDADLQGFPAVAGAVPMAPAARPAWADFTGYVRRALTADLVMLALAAFLTTFVSPTDSPTGEVPIQPLGWAIGFPLIVTSLFYLRGMYRPPLRPDLFETLRLVVTGLAVASIAVITARVVLANDAYVSAEAVRQLLIAIPLVVAGRWSLLWVETRARRAGDSATPTLVVGHGKVGSLTAKRLLAEPEVGLHPIGFLDDAPLAGFRDLPPVLGGLSELERVVAEHGVKHMIVAFTSSRDEDLLTLARRGWALGLSVSIVPRLFEIQQGQRVTMEHLGGLPLLQVSQADPDGWQFRVKYALDRIVAALAIVVLFPIMLAAGIAVKLSIGGPVLYRQRRVGLDGRVFEMLKLRTLADAVKVNSYADADWAAEQLGGREIAELAPMDDRTTPVGRMLRRLSLDELPQLWNVLRGDMSLVGPRPERASYVEAFEGGVYRYGERHRVKSGLTGWAQIHGLRGRTPLAERVEWDNHYIENWSLWLDLKIALRTFPCLLKGQGR
jgi:exopolysaccharide biosynthesis polyprenyl glycosylphosphotransferase